MISIRVVWTYFYPKIEKKHKLGFWQKLFYIAAIKKLLVTKVVDLVLVYVDVKAK